MRGRCVLGLFLGVTCAFAFYSASAAFTEALAFVRGTEDKWPPLSGAVGSVAQSLPSSTGYGFFAPQVSSEFRLLTRLGNSETGEVRELIMTLGSEPQMLVSSLNNSAQDSAAAVSIALTYASYGFARYEGYDSAEVLLQAEALPPLRTARTAQKTWRTLTTFYIKR